MGTCRLQKNFTCSHKKNLYISYRSNIVNGSSRYFPVTLEHSGGSPLCAIKVHARGLPCLLMDEGVLCPGEKVSIGTDFYDLTRTLIFLHIGQKAKRFVLTFPLGRDDLGQYYT